MLELASYPSFHQKQQILYETNILIFGLFPSSIPLFNVQCNAYTRITEWTLLEKFVQETSIFIDTPFDADSDRFSSSILSSRKDRKVNLSIFFTIKIFYFTNRTVTRDDSLVDVNNERSPYCAFVSITVYRNKES